MTDQSGPLHAAIAGALVRGGLSFSSSLSPVDQPGVTLRVYQLTYELPEPKGQYSVHAYVGGAVLNVLSPVRLASSAAHRLQELVLHVNSSVAFARIARGQATPQGEILWIYAQLPIPDDASSAIEIPPEMFAAPLKAVSFVVAQVAAAFKGDVEVVVDPVSLPMIYVPGLAGPDTSGPFRDAALILPAATTGKESA